MKKALVLFVALALVSIAIFSACEPVEHFEPRQDLDQRTMGYYDPVITVTYGRPWFANMISSLNKKGWTIDDNNWTRAIRKDLGIRLKLAWSLADSTDYFSKLTAAIAAGGLPDFANIHCAPEVYNYLKMLDDNDSILNIWPYYEQYASDELKECYELAGKEIFYPATFGGEIKALCSITGSENSSWSFYWIRSDWLDNLNMKVPTTYDELIDVIKAFRDKDPDGNGIKDTYGIPFDGSFFVYGATLFNSCHAYLDQWVELSDGTLGYGMVQPEVKRVLADLADLYQGGYLDTEATYYETAMTSGMCGVWPGLVHNGLFLQPTVTKNPNADFVPIRLVSCDNEEARPSAEIPSYQYYVVNKYCKHPEVLVKLLNYYLYITSLDADNEYAVDMFTDDEALELWQFAPVNVGKVGENYGRAQRVADALEAGSKEGLIGVDNDVYDWIMSYREGGNVANWGWDKIYGGRESSEYLMGHYLEEGLYEVNKFVGVKSDKMQETEASLKDLLYYGFFQIIRGEESVNYFDSLVEAWNDQGGRENTAYVNDWYKSIQG